MKKIVIFSVLSIILFGASAAVSMFLMPQPRDDETEIADSAGPVGPPPGVDPDAGDAESELPVPFQGDRMAEEAIVELANQVRKEQQALIDRQNEFAKKQARQRFVLDDIRREKEELEALQTMVKDKIAEAQQLVRKLQNEKNEISKKQTEIESSIAQLEDKQGTDAQIEEKNLGTLAKWLKAMPPEKSSLVIKGMCDDGDIELAVRILFKLADREVGKIIGPLEPQLVQQLADALRKLRSTNRTANSFGTQWK